MTELANQRGRREMVEALIYAAENPSRVLDVCSSTEDDDDLIRGLADSCGLTPFQAEVVLTMQVQRFSPQALARMRAELADIDRLIEALEA